MRKVLLILSLFISFQSYSQGCGDAGACSIDAMKNGFKDKQSFSKNSLKMGTTFGLAQYKVFIAAPYIEYRRYINTKLSLSAKISTAIHTGNITTTYDFSDIYLISSYHFSSKFRFLAGIKIPFNDANKKYNTIPLPMSYQSTLGTLDLILGVGYTQNHFSYSLAFQKVLVQNNNEFFKADYAFVGIDTNYLSTNAYQRESDVLLRISYQQQFRNKKHSIIYSLLPIFHLGQDSYQTSSNERVKIKDSEGLTLNLNVFYRYQVSEKKHFEFSLGAPVIARHSRPDGLTSLSIGIEYVILF